MTSDPRFARATDPRFLLGQLRQQLTELASEVAPYADLPLPTMRLPSRPDGLTGRAWEVPGRSRHRIAVISLDHEPGVFLEGGPISAGDWHAIDADEARQFAVALLAAADDSERRHSPDVVRDATR